MRSLILVLICFISYSAIAQEEINEDEFLPIVIDDKEAFLSTKTGEFVFLPHETTDASTLVTTASGVVYVDTQIHIVKKKESIHKISKKYGLSVDEVKQQNKLESNKLSIGQKIKIVKKLIVESSSPVISYSGEERIVAKLRPGQNPTNLNPPSKAPNSPVVVRPHNHDDEVKADKEILESNPETHIVKTGETLFSIGKKYNITIQELKKLNNLSLNNLSIGQKLKLH